eukprot:TRINITY_DN23528_c0_g1_i1.p1 TRINITY_DN23528_c0_g1~~TRINITY_DN23528_c0_g1_i1.p1  ORF type:complete len:1102 (+),score=221.52 TRINITY_DN23528_c0_g1_i1:75-3308(+)
MASSPLGAVSSPGSRRSGIIVGSRVRVLRGRQFQEFGSGDSGVVVHVDQAANSCDVAFDGLMGSPHTVAMRHLELASHFPEPQKPLSGCKVGLDAWNHADAAAGFEELAAKDEVLLARLRRKLAPAADSGVFANGYVTSRGVVENEVDHDMLSDGPGCGALAEAVKASASATASATAAATVEVISLRLALAELRDLLLQETEQRVAGLRSLDERMDLLRETRNAENERRLSAEQRQVAQKQAELQALCGSLQELREQLGKVEAGSSPLQSRCDGLEADIRALAERVTALASGSDESSRRSFGELTGRVNELAHSHAEMSRSFEDMQRTHAEVSRNLGGIGQEQLPKLQLQLDSLSMSHHELAQRHGDLTKQDPRIEQLRGELSRIDEAHRSQSELHHERQLRLASQEARQEKLHAEIFGKVEELSRRHADLARAAADTDAGTASRAEDLSAQLEELERAHRRQAATLRDALPTAARVNELGLRVEALRSEVASGQCRSAAVDTPSVDIQAFGNRVEALERCNAAHVESLRGCQQASQQVTELQFRLEALQSDFASQMLKLQAEQARQQLEFESRLGARVNAWNLEREASAALAPCPPDAVGHLREELSANFARQFAALREEVGKRCAQLRDELEGEMRTWQASNAVSQAAILGGRNESMAVDAFKAEVSRRLEGLERSSSQSNARVEQQASEALRVGKRASEALEAHCAAAREREKMLEVLQRRFDERLAEGLATEARRRDELISRLSSSQPSLAANLATSPPSVPAVSSVLAAPTVSGSARSSPVAASFSADISSSPREVLRTPQSPRWQAAAVPEDGRIVVRAPSATAPGGTAVGGTGAAAASFAPSGLASGCSGGVTTEQEVRRLMSLYERQQSRSPPTSRPRQLLSEPSPVEAASPQQQPGNGFLSVASTRDGKVGVQLQSAWGSSSSTARSFATTPPREREREQPARRELSIGAAAAPMEPIAGCAAVSTSALGSSSGSPHGARAQSGGSAGAAALTWNASPCAAASFGSTPVKPPSPAANVAFNVALDATKPSFRSFPDGAVVPVELEVVGMSPRLASSTSSSGRGGLGLR